MVGRTGSSPKCRRGASRNPDAERGASAREAFRRLLHTLLEPWGRIVAQELGNKLDLPGLLFDWSSIRGADVQGRARALKSMTDAGLPIEQASAIAGLIDE